MKQLFRNSEREQQPQVSIEYSIPYSWGALQVSEAAHDTYDLIPLTADVVESDIEVTSQEITPIKLLLVSPDEFSEGKPNDVNYCDFGQYRIDQEKGLNTVVTSLGIDAESVRSITRNGLGNIGYMLGLPIDNISDEDGIPVSESIEAETGQILAHKFSMLGSVAVKNLIHQDMLERENKRAVRTVTALGTAAAASSSIILGVNAATGTLDGFDFALAGGMASFYTMRLRSVVKKYLHNVRHINQLSSQAGTLVGGLVGEDVHSSYCKKVFDRNFEQLA